MSQTESTIEGAKAENPLTLDPQHLLFAEKYIELGFNQTKAAIAAGFSSKSARNQGYRLMRNDDIRAEIDRRMGELAMSKNEVLARLADQARGDMRDFANIKTAKALAQHPTGNVVKKFKRTILTTTDLDGKAIHTEEKIELELYDAQAAQVQIGRYHKLFTDNFDHTSGGDKLTAPMVFLPAVEPDEP